MTSRDGQGIIPSYRHADPPSPTQKWPHWFLLRKDAQCFEKYAKAIFRFFFAFFRSSKFPFNSYFWDLEMIRQEMSTKNLVLFRLRSNSDLHTFQRILSIWEKNSPQKKICRIFFSYNHLRRMQRFSHKNRSIFFYLYYFCIRFRCIIFLLGGFCPHTPPVLWGFVPNTPHRELYPHPACFSIESPS